MSAHPTGDVEDEHAPPVSTLRSKFEQLSVSVSTSKGGSRPSSVGHFDLLAPEPTSPRPRASSASNEPKPSPRLLRTASSSSDLKVEQRRAPPPPPPPRGSQMSTPTHSGGPSPLLRPVVPSAPSSPSSTPTPLSLEAKQALLARKPPPPPPSSSRGEPITTSAGVSALIHKFGNVTPSLPPSGSGFNSPRVVSHSSIILPTSSSNSSLLSDSSATDSPRAPRHSFPPESSPSIPPRIVLPTPVSSPFGDSSINHPSTSTRPPPLPSRKNGKIYRPPTGAEHGRAPSADSVSTVTSDSSSTSPPETASPVELASSPIIPPTRNPPPRPPPRNKNSSLSKQASLPTTTSSPSPISGTPPPLPARKPTGLVNEESRRVPTPPRHRLIADIDSPPNSAPPSIAVPSQTDFLITPVISPPPATTPSVLAERKAFGAHPPPPTRTIALGDKLPPARRQPSGSSSDEEEEEVTKKIELLPDSSRASRRPPDLRVHNYSESYIHVPAYTGVIAVAGSTVAVSSGHRLKIYDLTQADSPVHDLDSRGIGLEAKSKDFKVTSMEFRPATREADRGCYLWIGTKDGHLFELDVHAGLVVGMKLSIHTHAVTHMCRHGNNMVTLDETGKALVFSSDAPTADLILSATQPRVTRIADKQEFVKIIGGKLWTSARDPNGTSAGNTSRGPIIRVYDIFTAGSIGRSVLPTEHLGAVTSGTILQSQPGQAFIGHEGGNVSVWSLDTEDGLPVCQEVVKVSTSDILCLEGVNERLWTGGRKGNIAAYDVSHRPWVMTNNWQAHQKLPVLKLVTDTCSIQKLGRLSVYSVGRDEKIRFWDGLLGIDWIDQELLKRETEYSSFRDLTVLVVSWNMDSARPDMLTGSPDNINFLHDALTSVDAPDIISFGFQELIDLESRKMAAKSVLLGGKSRTTDGTISQRVTTAYKKWYDRLILAVRLAMPPDTPYTVIHTENLVGLFSCIFVKDTQRNNLRDAALTTIKRGMGGRYGNKGGIIARMVIDDSSICFINCHLAAGQHHVRQRNADVAAFLEEELFPESGEITPYVNGGDGTLVMDHDIVFLSGDMNYRIDLRRDAVVADIQKGDLSRLAAQDQLLKEMKNNRAFRLRPFSEGPLVFAPTYKYDRRSDEYDSSEKRRVPAWCDRVLWRSREPSRVKQLHYRRYEANVSDHRPISSAFRMTVKSISPERREPVKAEVTALWNQEESTLLYAAAQFYASQNMV